MPHEETTDSYTQEVTHTESANPIEAVAGQFGLNGTMFAAQLVNFLIVLIILWIFVYKPITRFLEERQEKIEKSVKQADEIEKRMVAIEKERDVVIVEARKEAQGIAEKAQVDAEKRGEEIIAAAKREVERVIVKGKQQLADEKTEMVREMRKDVVDIAMKAAARIVQDAVDEKKSKSLAEEVVRKMT
ncbi:MAG: F0F1 ATP synthase subunit B [Patescibacteria group bacterium]